ncbi:Reverse transcriptase domain-containing protein, partial [Aphis craccivora]
LPSRVSFEPLLFLIFINDLPLVLELSIKILLLADVAKIFCKIKSVDDQHSSQINLNKLYV